MAINSALLYSFGADVMAVSTVTGTRDTLQLDPNKMEQIRILVYACAKHPMIYMYKNLMICYSHSSSCVSCNIDFIVFVLRVAVFYCFAVYLSDVVVSCLLCGLGFMFGVQKRKKQKRKRE